MSQHVVAMFNPLTPSGFRLELAAKCPVFNAKVQVKINDAGLVFGCVNQCRRIYGKREQGIKVCCDYSGCLIGEPWAVKPSRVEITVPQPDFSAKMERQFSMEAFV